MKRNPLGLKYRLQLYRENTGETLVRYDIHQGKSHHRHFLGEEQPYVWRSVEKLFEDLRRDIDRVRAMLEEGGR